MTSSTRISATPRSLMFQVPGSGFQVQIARRDVELNLEIRNHMTRASRLTSIGIEHASRTTERRHCRLHAERETHATYAQQVGIESVACARIGTPWTIAQHRRWNLDGRPRRTQRAQPGLVMAIDD